MKRSLFLCCLVALAVIGYSQEDSIKAPYKPSPVFPPVKLLLPDKTTFFTKSDLPGKTAILLILFDPHCEHCKHETEEIIRNIDKLKEVEIVMATIAPYDSMMKFRENYNLAKFSNIIIGQDVQFFLPTFFMIDMLPLLAFYDNKQELIKVIRGPHKFKDVLKVFK
jgi:hypothetical protein